MTRSEIVQKAREYIGTPYVHQGRVKGPGGGVDCAGLIWCVAHEVGYAIGEDYLAYHRIPDEVVMKDVLEKYLDYVEVPQVGDVLLVSLIGDGPAAHTAILAQRELHQSEQEWEWTIIHAYYTFRAVVETRLDSAVKIRGAYRFRGSDYG